MLRRFIVGTRGVKKINKAAIWKPAHVVTARVLSQNSVPAVQARRASLNVTTPCSTVTLFSCIPQATPPLPRLTAFLSVVAQQLCTGVLQAAVEDGNFHFSSVFDLLPMTAWVELTLAGKVYFALLCCCPREAQRTTKQATSAIATHQLVSHVVSSSASIAVKCTGSPLSSHPATQQPMHNMPQLQDSNSTFFFFCHAQDNRFHSWR